MINIGTIAKHYGILPSQVREQATTYDLMIYDVMVSWEQFQQQQAQGGPAAVPKLSQEQLTAMIDRTKNRTQGSQ